MIGNFDIIVVGAGHAGCEAAYIASKMGSKVLLITMDMGKIAQMSCNPAIGGVAKGQIIREIDALGGASGLVTDSSTIQFRMLNRSKGPAMWSPRAQCDRMHYSLNWRYILENSPNLSLWQDKVISFTFTNDCVSGVITELGAQFSCRSVILTAGTFLNGKLFIGSDSTAGGRVGEPTSEYLSDQLSSYGFVVDKMKTGTPPRIDVRSIDLSQLEIQPGDSVPERFSYNDLLSPIQAGLSQMSCYMVHTNNDVHDALKSGFSLSPLFSGKIAGRGPRYCPSIEDKLKTFSDKSSHQLFLEPEGWFTNEYYLQGFSSSLPLSVQYKALRLIPGFDKIVIYRPAYAVEYDYFPPTQLYHTLETKSIDGLYFAGQVNGTTGYEEAAAQGLIAGINAHQKINSLEPLILRRDEAYIGVLIDDLVTKGVDEPYRMFTSRAEYRILLRQDNADLRLTPIARKLGLISDQRYSSFESKYRSVDLLTTCLTNTTLKPDYINKYLISVNSAPISQPKKASDILTRPQVTIDALLDYVPRETYSASLVDSQDICTVNRERYAELKSRGIMDWDNVPLMLPYIPKGDYNLMDYSNNRERMIVSSAEIKIKYKGYIEREKKIADKILRLEDVKIPDNFDYNSLLSISTESRQKLMRYKPKTISQASRIPGVSPADISVLLVYFGR